MINCQLHLEQHIVENFKGVNPPLILYRVQLTQHFAENEAGREVSLLLMLVWMKVEQCKEEERGSFPLFPTKLFHP